MYRRQSSSVVLILLCAVFSACTRTTDQTDQAKPAPDGANRSPRLLGDLRSVVTVKELMRDAIDPLSDNIFEAVGQTDTPEGVQQWEPKSDEDWAKVRTGAVVLAESANLLKMPRPFAPPGDVGNSIGPYATELSPDAIQAKVDKDEALWSSYVEGFRLVAIDLMGAADRKDIGALHEGISALDRACENCHLEYWYPGDREIYKKFFSQKPADAGSMPAH